MTRLSLLLELTSACRARCVFCPHPGGAGRSPERMPREWARRAIDQAAAAGFQELHPQFMGEPGEASELVAWACDYARSAGMLTVIYSNGLRQPLHVPDRLVWSLDYADTETCAKIRPGLDFVDVRLNVEAWWHANRALYPYREIVARVTACKENSGTAGAVAAYWKPWAHKTVIVPEVPRTRTVAGWKVNDSAPCTAVGSQLVIYSDGTAVACCQDLSGAWPLGKFPRKSVEELWTGEPLQELRRRVTACDWPDHCLTCVRRGESAAEKGAP